jgi:hypothetical protein
VAVASAVTSWAFVIVRLATLSLEAGLPVLS